MYFTKIPHPSNFEFACSFDAQVGKITVGGKAHNISIDSFEGNIWRISLDPCDLWEGNLSLVPCDEPAPGRGDATLEMDASAQLILKNPAGEVVLTSDHRGGFGLMGAASCFCFAYDRKQQFYGLGEKTFPTLEHSHRRTRFWNTDALGDFDFKTWDNQALDPYYASVPYLIVRVGKEFVGLLLENPFASFVDCGSDASFFGNEDENRRVVIGAEAGQPRLWVIYGPTLAELTVKLQNLVGKTPLPPAWALGYHQCRWGYKGEEDLLWLDAKMTQHAIPNDGLWLDIDYMNGYRVFSHEPKHWPSGVEKALANLRAKGRRVLPILDPGVKLDPDYAVYQSGIKEDIFCKNPQGKEYIGFVWPGLTVFPDYSMPEGRSWWADHAAKFKALGYAGAWLDMNDPSTGAIDPMAMQFRKGSQPHEAFHNQYALGMQMATFEGFRKACPNDRIFMISRSGFTGTSRYSAIWTGDNLSSRYYLKNTIPCALNLGLSGIPFSGPDVGGFMHDTNEELMVDWTMAGFLFPFFRIHSVKFNRPQEPWTFGPKALQTIRHYIRLRYKLLPYLMSVFAEQEEVGHPILRPVMYHYEEAVGSSDTFLVGRDVFQAPFMDEGQGRTATLPGRAKWFDARSGEWLKPGQIKLERQEAESPVFFRHGSIIPTLPGVRKTNEKPLNQVEFHIFVTEGQAQVRYRFDDGETLDYQNGKQSEIVVRASVRNGIVNVNVDTVREGFGPIDATFVVYTKVSRATVNGKRVRVKSARITWTGQPIDAQIFGA